MSQKSGPAKWSSERIVKDIRRATRKQYSAEEKSASFCFFFLFRQSIFAQAASISIQRAGKWRQHCLRTRP
jgi:hypothetical protein